MKRWIVLMLCLGLPARAQPTPEPSQAALDDAIRLGVVATLAPLCGLRPEGWAFDLRRATIMNSTHITRPEDPALRAVPGSTTVVGALSFAEAEALETFAQSTPNDTCAPLKLNPDLVRADAIVQAFRDLRNKAKLAS